MEYDLCIVGAGMIGSSAARHAAALGKRVCLIGPNEPENRQGKEIFGAHYDEARITRSTATAYPWAILSSRSIARYRQLETDSDIKFYQEVGCLTLGDKDGQYLQNTYESAKKQDLSSVDILSVSELQDRFPYFGVYNSNIEAVFETKNAGYINPRSLVEIEQKLAQRDGCVIIKEIVKSVETVDRDGNESDPVMKVTTDEGQVVMARKVLLATGAFTEFRSLLPPGLSLDLLPVTQTIVFAELSAEDQVKLKDMPSMLIFQNDPPITAENKSALEVTDYDCYILPPVKYPNGKVYLKLGHGTNAEILLKSPSEITNWFTSKVPKDFEELLLFIFRMTFPDLKPLSFHTDSCVTVNTPNDRPFIDLVTPQLAVALGDNGCSAKSCDELGRLAASLALTGKWEDTELPREWFSITVKSGVQDSKL